MQETYLVRFWFSGGESFTLGTLQADSQKEAQAAFADLLVECDIRREHITLDVSQRYDLTLPGGMSFSVRPLPNLRDRLPLAIQLYRHRK